MAGILAFQFARNPANHSEDQTASESKSAHADTTSRAELPLGSYPAHRSSLDEFERLLQADTLDASLVEQIIARIHSADLRLALQRAEKASDGIRRMLISALLTRIAEEDPQAAVHLASNLADISIRNEELEKQLQNWMRTAPAEATIWAKTQLNGSLLDAAAAASNPADDRDREQACIAIAKAWAIVDPAAASQWVQSLPDSHQRLLALQAIFASWADTDAKSACSAASLLSQPELRSKAYTQIGTEWAKNDAEGALAWIRSLPSNEGGEAFRSVLLHLSQSSPEQAMNQALVLSSESGAETVSFLLQQWAARDASAAAKWVNSLPPGPNREAALADVLPAWMASNPEAAAKEVLGVADNDRRLEMLNVVAASWAKKDPVAAMTWALNSQDETVMNAGVIQSIITQWTAEGTEPVASWLNKLPQSDFRDNAIAAFARTIGAEHPQAALTWANSITDSSRRAEVLEGIALRWIEQDELTARHALAGIDLPSSVREHIDAR